LNHQVSKADWNEEAGLWYVEATNTDSGEIVKTSCNVLINAGGILNSWRWPAIPGLQSYRGKLVHSAAWDQDLVLAGKVVGLIGNGYLSLPNFNSIQLLTM
jgi:cation diffusion facilitator CzcD-associated flavoprotein CzcO